MNRRMWPAVFLAGAVLMVGTWLAPEGLKHDMGERDLHAPAEKSAEHLGGSPGLQSDSRPPASFSADTKPGIEASASKPRSPSTEDVPSDVDLRDEDVISVGSYIDPDDPTTWPQDDNAEIISIGEYVDPDDPDTWPLEQNAKIISIGEYVDPDGPAASSVAASPEILHLGEFVDPQAQNSWPADGVNEIVDIGEYIDPDDPSNGSRY